ncbi:MAG TPA: hypothetical protein VN723_16115 [Rhizomicrobium sp.]|nr:hypothetical protein [Rhizomicrobium sp.]
MTDHALAFYGQRRLRLSNEEERRLLVRRVISWTLVGLIHVLLLSLFILDQIRERSLMMRREPVETILDLTKLPVGEAPPIRLIRPEVPAAAPPPITTAPAIVVPPINPDQAVPHTPEDILKAIGEALSCGAENFENLTQAERARCKNEPWIARKLPNGTIVLEAANPSPFAPPPEPKLSGADAIRRQMQTAPPCPILVNTPCLSNTPMVGIGIPTN